MRPRPEPLRSSALRMEADLRIGSCCWTKQSIEFSNRDIWVYLDSLGTVPVAVKPRRDIDGPQSITRCERRVSRTSIPKRGFRQSRVASRTIDRHNVGNLRHG